MHSLESAKKMVLRTIGVCASVRTWANCIQAWAVLSRLTRVGPEADDASNASLLPCNSYQQRASARNPPKKPRRGHAAAPTTAAAPVSLPRWNPSKSRPPAAASGVVEEEPGNARRLPLPHSRRLRLPVHRMRLPNRRSGVARPRRPPPYPRDASLRASSRR
jgi:hypothetical protein